jgi:RimJ/RimL family protein N-acetyltransferase
VDDHERLVDELRRAIQQRDADRIAELLHPDVRLRLYSSPDEIVGREAARAWYREAFSRRIVFQGDAATAAEDTDTVVMRGRIYWYEPDQGGRDQPGEWRIGFRDGLIASIDAGRPAD